MVCYAISLARKGKRWLAEQICPRPELLDREVCWLCKYTNEELKEMASEVLKTKLKV